MLLVTEHELWCGTKTFGNKSVFKFQPLTLNPCAVGKVMLWLNILLYVFENVGNFSNFVAEVIIINM